MKIHDLITTTAALTDLCQRLAKSDFVTVDTEFMRENTYWPELCLVQIADDKEAAAIDPLAPGIDLYRDVLAHMSFTPRISPGLQTMDMRLFEPGPLGLREQLLNRPLVQRFELDAARQLLHIDFSGLQINTASTIAAIEQEVRGLLAPLAAQGERVGVIVNYDHFTIAPDLADAYAAMVQGLTRDHYAEVKRYGTVGFLKSRLT